MMDTLCVTGHRPNKLFGYNLSHPKWVKLKEIFKELLIQHECKEAISGMALGVDTIFALAVLELKESGNDIKLHVVIPCLNQSCKWRENDQKLHQSIVDKADKVTYVSSQPYSRECMQKRNEFMVDNSDGVIAVWDGSPGGTANCVLYAKKVKKPVLALKVIKE